jgi:hypothetical protein
MWRDNQFQRHKRFFVARYFKSRHKKGSMPKHCPLSFAAIRISGVAENMELM